MNAEQRGGMALNKDFRSKTGNGSVSREGRAIATPTGELHPQHPSLLPSLHLSLFISPSLVFYSPLCVKTAGSLSFSSCCFLFCCCYFLLTAVAYFHFLPCLCLCFSYSVLISVQWLNCHNYQKENCKSTKVCAFKP